MGAFGLVSSDDGGWGGESVSACEEKKGGVRNTDGE